MQKTSARLYPRDKYGISTRMPLFRLARILRAKIRDYLLSTNNPNGKAAFFKALGYTTKNADRFKEDLLDGLKRNKAFVYAKNKRGDVSIGVTMELGITKRAEVVTAWAIESGEKNPHLVIAYPRRAKGKR